MSNIKSLITTDAARKQIAAALPSHMTVDRQVRVALTAINKTPKLAACNQSSFVEALMTCSELGLEPNGRHAHLIPYGDRCTLIIDYKGLIDLAYRSERIRSIYAAVVYDGDAFDYATCRHTPWAWLNPSERKAEPGARIGAFCVVEMINDATHRERMTIDEVEAIRQRSRASSSGPWVTDFDEMAKKTVFRRASKWIPQSSQLQRAIEVDDATSGFDRRTDRSVSNERDAADRAEVGASLTKRIEALHSTDVDDNDEGLDEQLDQG